MMWCSFKSQHEINFTLAHLTLIYNLGGGWQICPPGSFFATAQKRLALDC